MEQEKKERKTNAEFIPQFTSAFLHPRYWGIWLVVGVMALLVCIPARLRDPILGTLGRWVGRLSKGARRRARINLLLCMPQLTENEREHIIDQMFATAPQAMLMMVELAILPASRAYRRVRWHGMEIVDALREQQRNIIFMVPHGWAVDIPAMLMSWQGQKMAAMMHNQKNPLQDYLWNTLRRRFGGRLHTRNDGIKPFIGSVREGYWGYYLPDQDHGAEHSEFVDFFATYKATLPAIGRLMKVCRAEIVPLFPVYNGKTSQLDIYIRPPMSDINGADDNTIARRMNEEVEHLVAPNPEQYTWILKLLKTRKPGETEPYLRKDLYPRKK
ncbi:lauroyl-Kdo(2)-lipid IV(A) myristoyltransferase [Dickeya zeae]|uniref:lauroyl-Kdo(2)-lipid IV(A) myristoyltransferase n=1 Tax=Dickeya zeae TaxID=204042 RepID=UPI001CFA02C3|nr:lauroyl-Kdo(2)-lipid IV(A) myristoyltransferase [Dickeya zeae]UCZ75395.1 lauroyl-Kdo(2)-lipid IV(A) myristoyltransferase [Dickeya zeae]